MNDEKIVTLYDLCLLLRNNGGLISNINIKPRNIFFYSLSGKDNSRVQIYLNTLFHVIFNIFSGRNKPQQLKNQLF